MSNPNPLLGSVPSGNVLTPWNFYDYYGFNQVSGIIQGAYNTDGKGQTIAIIDAYGCPTVQSDLDYFCQQMAIPSTNVGVYYPLGQPSWSTPSNTQLSWSLETSLGVQYAHAMAVSANIVLVVSPDASFNNLKSCISYAVDVLKADVISMSWGATEDSTFYDSGYDNIFTSLSAQYLASSGDSGAEVVYPASSPRVFSIGGTVLYGGDARNYNGAPGSYYEVGWSNGGGGISKINSIPLYQDGWSSFPKRSVPDVSYNAGGNCAVYMTNPFTAVSGWYSVGGTSAATAQWAAIVARRNSCGYSVKNKKTINEDIYAISILNYNTLFYDIKQGSNGYNASYIYDLVSGLGSPKVYNLLPQIATPTPTPTQTPTHTPTQTPTNTPTPSITPTQTTTPTVTPTPNPSFVPSATPTNTPTNTRTPAPPPSKTPTPTSSPLYLTPTKTPSNTPTPSITPSKTPIASRVPIIPLTPLPSRQVPPTPTPTPNVTPTVTPSNKSPIVPLPQPSHTPVPTRTPTPTNSPTPSVTGTPGISHTPTPTITNTPSMTPSVTPTATSTPISTSTPTPTPTATTISLLSNLKAFYPFNGNTLDYSGNGIRLGSGKSCVYNYTTAKVGTSAIQFTNFGYCFRSAGLTYPNNIWNLYDGNTSASYSLWFKYTQDITFPGGCGWTFFGSDYGNFGFNISPTYNTNEIHFGLAGVGQMGNPTTLTVGQWYHIVGTYDNTTGSYKIYMNNNLIVNQTPTMSAPGQNYQGFAINGSGYGVDGEYGIPIIFDAVGLWTRLLTPYDVNRLYNNGNGLEYPF
jgi:hypothetical protein